MSESKATPLVFGPGQTASIKLGTPLAELKFDELDVDADTKELSVKLLKQQVRENFVARLKYERDEAEAHIDPMKAINRRFSARFDAAKESLSGIDKMIDEGVTNKLPLGQITQAAMASAGAFVGIGNMAAEMAAPSRQAITAWHSLDTGPGTPGVSTAVTVRKPAKPRAPSKRAPAKKPRKSAKK